MPNIIKGEKIFNFFSKAGFYFSIIFFAFAYTPVIQDIINFPKEFFLYASLVVIGLPFLISLFFATELEYKKSIFDWPIIILCFYLIVNAILSLDSRISFFGRSDIFVLHTTIILGWVSWYLAGIQFISTQKIWQWCKNLLLVSGLGLTILFLIGPFISFLQIPLNTVTKNNSLLGVYIAIILILNLGFILVSNKIANTVFYLTGATLQIIMLLQLGFNLPWIVASIGIAMILSFFLFKLPKFADWKFILVLVVLISGILFSIFGAFSFLKIGRAHV